MEIGDVFCEELRDEFSKLEMIVLQLEKGGNTGALRDQLKRILPNMKGSAGVAGYTACARLIHQMENLLIEHGQSDISQLMLSGIDLALHLTQRPEEHDKVQAFEKQCQAIGKPDTRVEQGRAVRQPMINEPGKRPCQVKPLRVVKVLGFGEETYLKPYETLLSQSGIQVNWVPSPYPDFRYLHERRADAIILAFPELRLQHGGIVRSIRRFSETIPLLIVSEDLGKELLIQMSRLENVSCFAKSQLCPLLFIRHLCKRVVMARQSLMLSRALKAIWYLDPNQDSQSRADTCELMSYQDEFRAALPSHLEWDFGNHSSEDKTIVLRDAHGEIEYVLKDLMHCLDKRSLPGPTLRLHHKHLMDCVLQHFTAENAMMQAQETQKKFLEQHIRSHKEISGKFQSQRVLMGLDEIRQSCEQLCQFLRQHESFDRTLEEFLHAA